MKVFPQWHQTPLSSSLGVSSVIPWVSVCLSAPCFDLPSVWPLLSSHRPWEEVQRLECSRAALGSAKGIEYPVNSLSVKQAPVQVSLAHIFLSLIFVTYRNPSGWNPLLISAPAELWIFGIGRCSRHCFLATHRTLEMFRISGSTFDCCFLSAPMIFSIFLIFLSTDCGLFLFCNGWYLLPSMTVSRGSCQRGSHRIWTSLFFPMFLSSYPNNLACLWNYNRKCKGFWICQ